MLLIIIDPASRDQFLQARLLVGHDHKYARLASLINLRLNHLNEPSGEHIVRHLRQLPHDLDLAHDFLFAILR